METEHNAEIVRCRECRGLFPVNEIVWTHGPGTWVTNGKVDWEPHPWCRPCHQEMFNDNALIDGRMQPDGGAR